jgi:hypothetical protein
LFRALPPAYGRNKHRHQNKYIARVFVQC